MRLSIVIPSNRDNLTAYSTIMRACSWGSYDIEVVVRDNSGSAKKKKLLAGIGGENCKIVIAPPCDAMTNFRESLLASTGEFIIFMGDDDFCFDRGIAAIAEAATTHADDPSVAGLTGAYALEESHASQIVSYSQIDSADPVERMRGYLGYQGPNLIFYSAIRRSVAAQAWQFMAEHPFKFPFHDQLISLIYLLSGRFLHVGRLIFAYDNGNWDVIDVGAQSDLKFYVAAGMDPAFRRLQWMICAFEGASVILNSRMLENCSLSQRSTVANQWFELMFRRFAGDINFSEQSRFTAQAAALREKFLSGFPNFTLDSILHSICEFIALSSPEKAALYGAFWNSVAANDQK